MGSDYSVPAPHTIPPAERGAVLDGNVSLENIARGLSSGRFKNVIVLAGAGISVSAGIPDFRTPGTGLYDNLAKYDLPRPEAVFDIEFFQDNPKPFFLLAKEMWPDNFKPTPTHYFLKLLHDKGVLRRVYTQNIDTLERAAGIPGDVLVEAHGSFATAHSIDPEKRPYDADWVKEKLMAGEIPRCPETGALVKPDIVFFGEALPSRFHDLIDGDVAAADLCIVMGTSLQVYPVACVPDRVGHLVPRVLLNREVVHAAEPGEIVGSPGSISAGDATYDGDGGPVIKEGVSPPWITQQKDKTKDGDSVIEIDEPPSDTTPEDRLKWLLSTFTSPDWIKGHGNDKVEPGFRFGFADNYRDVAFLGNCDDGVRYICDVAGWSSDLDSLIGDSRDAGDGVGKAAAAAAAAARTASAISPAVPRKASSGALDSMSDLAEHLPS